MSYTPYCHWLGKDGMYASDGGTTFKTTGENIWGDLEEHMIVAKKVQYGHKSHWSIALDADAIEKMAVELFRLRQVRLPVPPSDFMTMPEQYRQEYCQDLAQALVHYGKIEAANTSAAIQEAQLLTNDPPYFGQDLLASYPGPMPGAPVESPKPSVCCSWPGCTKNVAFQETAFCPEHTGFPGPFPGDAVRSVDKAFEESLREYDTDKLWEAIESVAKGTN